MAVLVVAALAGCAGATDAGAGPDSDGTASLGALAPALPDGEVIGQGTVIDVAGTAELCLGAVAESYPPQCAGLPLDGWSWDGVDGAETSGDVTWGAYVVQGTYDGATLAVTQSPILLALYDPMMMDDPTGGRPGAGSELDFAPLQEMLPGRLDANYLSSTVVDGWLWIDVVWDDGTLQDAADADFGADTVIVRSALRPVG